MTNFNSKVRMIKLNIYFTITEKIFIGYNDIFLDIFLNDKLIDIFNTKLHNKIELMCFETQAKINNQL